MSSTDQNNELVWEDRPDCNCGKRARKYVQRKGGPNQGREMYLCHERNEWLNYQREALQLETALAELPANVRPTNSWVQRANARWGSGTLEKDPKALRPENKAPGCDFFMYKSQWDLTKNKDRFSALRKAINESSARQSTSSGSKGGPSVPVHKPLPVLKTVEGSKRSEVEHKPYDRPRVHFEGSLRSEPTTSIKGKEREHIGSSLQVEPPSSHREHAHSDEIYPVDYIPFEDEEYRLVTGLMNYKDKKIPSSSSNQTTKTPANSPSKSNSSNVQSTGRPAHLEASPAVADQVARQLTQAVENWRTWFERVLVEVGEELDARLSGMQPSVNQQLREALDPKNFGWKKDA